MLFTREQLLDKLGSEDQVVNQVEETTRWSTYYFFVFKHEGKLYEAPYSVGSTEMQEEYPWEDEPEVECGEVEAYEKTVTAFRPVK